MTRGSQFVLLSNSLYIVSIVLDRNSRVRLTFAHMHFTATFSDDAHYFGMWYR